MAIKHIVLFGWKKTATPEQIDDAYSRMLALKEKCLHPTSKQPYIKASIGGRNNSPEVPARGLDHGFIVEFENKEDRDYYLDKDPEHLAFIEFAGPLLENVKVFDFEPGKF